LVTILASPPAVEIHFGNGRHLTDVSEQTTRLRQLLEDCWASERHHWACVIGRRSVATPMARILALVGGGGRACFPLGEPCTGLEITLSWLSCTHQETPQDGVNSNGPDNGRYARTCILLLSNPESGLDRPGYPPIRNNASVVPHPPMVSLHDRRQLTATRFSTTNMNTSTGFCLGT